jgi:hypothetical protein
MLNRIAIFVLLLLTTSAFSQGGFTDFQVGVLMPADAQTGFVGGVFSGKMVDNNMGYGFEINYYSKGYTKETKVASGADGQVSEDRIVTEIENSTTLIPILFKLVYAGQAGPNFDYRAFAGVGYQLLWNSETNHLEGKDESRFYSGFAWQLGVGANYPISRSADVFGELAYHGGSPSRDEGETIAGLPVRTEVDMGGLMLRVGVRLINFGF